MKETLRLLTFFVVSVSLISSCAKYDKMLDINLGNMGIDGNMHWGIPLINAGYSIEEVLDQFGDMGFIKYEPNGNYFFEYIIPKAEYLDATQFNKIDDVTKMLYLDFEISKKSMDVELEQTFEDNNIDFLTEDMNVKEAILKSGKMKFDFSNVQSEYDYDVRITSDKMYYVDDPKRKFDIVLPSNRIALVDCNGLKVETDNSQLSFDITITLRIPGTPTMPSLLFNPVISLTDIELREATVELLTDYSQSFVTAAEFSFFSENADLNVTLHNPRLMLNVTNTFGITAQLMLSKIYLKGETSMEPILLQDDTPISIPANAESVDITNYIKRDILLTSNYDSLIFDCTAIAPAGIVSIHDNSLIAAGATLTVPFAVTIDKAVFNDTLAFNLPGLSSLSIIDTVEVRTAFSSSIPSDFGVQILLYNSEKQEVIGTLLTNPLTIKGSYTDGNVPVPSDIQYITVTNSSLESLQDADKLILQLSLNTDGKSKTFNQSNSLQARVGARIKTATNF